MISTKPIGQIPSPYGTMIDVFFDRTKHVDEDNCYFHNADGCMDIAGVYGEENRRRCREEMRAAIDKTGGMSFEVFARFGGQKVPCEPLPRPRESAYTKFDWNDDIQAVVNNWVTLALDCRNWTERAKRMLTEAVAPQLPGTQLQSIPEEFHSFVIGITAGHMLTASFEHLPDTEIDCLEAAALYAMTLHEEWSAPAIRWLSPFRDTWFRDWVRLRPVYRDLARRLSTVDDTRPTWLAGG